jgi:type I restriction-modification system DNA methylase subunit
MPDSPFNNSNLFSNHYLERLVMRTPEWEDVEELDRIYSEIKELLIRRLEVFKSYNEAQLENALIKPILSALGHHFEVQEKVAKGQHTPDYGFFPDKKTLNESHLNKADFYAKALAVGDAKRWTISLDKNQQKAKGQFDMLNPSFQIDTYLRETAPKWGILTNGHKWRLYHQDTSYKLDSFYEVDLVELIQKGDLNNFKYFYLFFRREAFLSGPDGRSFLDRVRDGSVAYAREIGEDLKENVYRAMKVLSEGFLNEKQNRLLAADVGEIQENAMRLLYRLLFIFYAESRRLLDVENRYYGPLSLRQLTSKVAEKLDGDGGLMDARTSYWSWLNDLFILINEGSEARGYSKEEFYIPAYNGGLFDPEKNSFLEGKRIGDLHLAEAIDLLARSGEGEERGAVDYSSLDIRHLGSIYEGLLEYRLKVAEGDLVAVKVKGREVWVPEGEAGRGKVLDRVSKGGIYLATDKGERKATGSYYTPDYIVKYIVENTLTPIIEEKKQEWFGTLGDFAEQILSIKVLDPAMGSGHFLVEATDWLARALVQAWAMARPEDESEETAEFDIHWARREVVRRCIYGVDINPMAVELAKLSLWLTTVAANKPLSFLDHHLRCRNSLIGAELEALINFSSTENKNEVLLNAVVGTNANIKGKKLARMRKVASDDKQYSLSNIFQKLVKQNAYSLIEQYKEIASKPDDDLATIKDKEAKFKEIQESELNQRFKELANVWLSTKFGNQVSEDDYYELRNHLSVERSPDWTNFRSQFWFANAQDIAFERRFINWELEFPEVFFEDEAGFDAVVGNPPYVRQEFLGDQKNYFQKEYVTYHGTADLYVYFFEKAQVLLRQGGAFGFISSNKFMRSNYGRSLREFLRDGIHIREIIDFGELPVFSEAATFPAIILTEKANSENPTKYTQIKSLEFERLDDVVKEQSRRLTSDSLRGDSWNLRRDNETKIMEKMMSMGVQLSDYVNDEIYFGIKTGLNEAFIVDKTLRDKLIIDDPSCQEILKPIVFGDNVKKYEIDFQEKYLIFTRKGIDIERYPSIKKHLEQFKDKLTPKNNKNDSVGRKPGKYNWYEIQDTVEYHNMFNKPKILVPAFALEPKFAFDNGEYFINGPAYIISTNDLMILSLLNSKLCFNYLLSTCSVLGDQEKRGRAVLRTIYYKQLPIRRINFTTPEDERTRLVSELKELYAAGRFEEVLVMVDECLPKDSSGGFVADREKSDVVHDLLAYLAEQMIEMNKEKQGEIRGFLDWLRGDMGAEVDDLSKKTKIQAYYEHDFAGLLEVLKKNKRKLKTDYSARKPQERLKEEFESSISTLTPLLARIRETDELIDQVVYKLYGLTEEEIKIIDNANAK